jgi:hypothetical protein
VAESETNGCQVGAGILEPNEGARAVAVGLKAGWIWWLVLSPFDLLEGPLGIIVDSLYAAMVGALKLGRAYVVTDRNVYVGQLRSWKVVDAQMSDNAVLADITELLIKQPLDSATVALRGSKMTLNGSYPIRIARLGPSRRWAKEAVAAAADSGSAAH